MRTRRKRPLPKRRVSKKRSPKPAGELRRAEKEIRNLARFPGENPSPVLRIARDGRLLYANRSSQRLLEHWHCAQVGQSLPGTECGWIAEALEHGSDQNHEVTCGGVVYSLELTPILETGYVNVYGRDITARKRAEAALVALSSRQEAILAAVSEIIMEVDRHKVYTWANPAGLTFFGADVVGREAAFYFEGEQSTYQAVQPLFDGQEGMVYVESWQRRQDGEKRLIAWWCRVLKDGSGHVTGALSSGCDITESKRAETDLRRVNRALRLISLFNQAMVRTTDEMSLMQVACRLAVEPGGYRLAWVGFAEADEAQSVRPVARCGFDDGYVDTAKMTWADDERGRGPTGTAIRTGQPVAIRDIRTDPTFGSWREAALQRGFVSSIALPLQAGGRCFGVLNLYAGEAGAFDPEEVKLLVELADDLAYGIGTSRQRTERTQAEAALQLAHARLRRFVDANIVGIVIANAAGTVIDANDYYLRLIGCTREELDQGKIDWRALTPPEWLPADEQAIREMRERDTCTPYEKEYVRRDGTRVAVFLADTKLPGPGDQIAAFVLDLTERKRAEKAVGESEAKYRALFDGSPDGILIADIETKAYKYANAAACRMLGYTEDEFRTMGVSDIHPKDVMPGVLARFAAQVHGSKTLAMDIPCLRKDGSVVPTDINAVKITIDGRPCNVGFFRDVTERKQDEEALANSQAFYHSLVDQLPAGVFRKDREGRYVFVSPWFCRLKGMKEEEFLGKTPREVAAKPAATEQAIKYAGDGIDHHRLIMQTGNPIELIEEYTDAAGEEAVCACPEIPRL